MRSIADTSAPYFRAPAEAVRVLEQLREHGGRIALDDFGTGYSSLSQPKDLSLDTLKTDYAFVRDLSRLRLAPHYALALVRAITTAAETLEVEVVAEGVESEEVARTLQGLGGHVAQGYFFARPLPADELRVLFPLGHSGFERGALQGALVN